MKKNPPWSWQLEDCSWYTRIYGRRWSFSSFRSFISFPLHMTIAVMCTDKTLQWHHVQLHQGHCTVLLIYTYTPER